MVVRRIHTGRCEQAVSIGYLPLLCKVQQSLTEAYVCVTCEISSLLGHLCEHKLRDSSVNIKAYDHHEIILISSL